MIRILFYLLFIPCAFLFSAENPDEAATVFYIVRHGQTDWNVQKKIQGHADIPLNDTGRAQAAELSETLGPIAFDYCFSSDLQRAAETALILNRNSSIQVDQRLRERNFGPWEGCFASEYNDSLNRQGSSVESDEAVLNRVLSFLHEKADLHSGANILIVTHGGVMRNVIAEHFSISASDVHVENMALLQLKASNGQIEIQELQGIELP